VTHAMGGCTRGSPQTGRHEWLRPEESPQRGLVGTDGQFPATAGAITWTFLLLGLVARQHGRIHRHYSPGHCRSRRRHT